MIDRHMYLFQLVPQIYRYGEVQNLHMPNIDKNNSRTHDVFSWKTPIGHYNFFFILSR
jgi:hypothetical protein